MSKSAPAPPDPRQTSAAQTGTNVTTATANAFMQNPNQITPYGTFVQRQTGMKKVKDPYTGKTYKIPLFTQTQRLSPEQQRIFNQTQDAQLSLARTASDQAEFLQKYMKKPLGSSSLGLQPELPTLERVSGNLKIQDINAPDQSAFARSAAAPTMGQVNFTDNFSRSAAAPTMGMINFTDNFSRSAAAPTMGMINFTDNFSRSAAAPSLSRMDSADPELVKGYQNDFSADRSRVEQAILDRARPTMDRDRASLEARLTNQGIRVGSAAYTAAMNDFDQRANDLTLGAILAGGQEQSRMTDLARNEAAFRNAALMDQRGLEQGRIAFNNDVNQQGFLNANTANQFNNALIQQAFENQATAQGFNNTALQQNFNNANTANQFNNALIQQAFDNQATAQGFNNTALQQNFNNANAANQFNNDLLQRAFDNQMSATGFNNTARQQDFTNANAANQFNNALIQQGFDNQRSAAGFNNANEIQRQQMLMQATSMNNNAALQEYSNAAQDRTRRAEELFAFRNQPINEISALLSQSQVQAPQFKDPNIGRIPTTDNAAIINQDYQNRLAQWQANQSVMGGVIGGIGSLFALSDRRAKKDVRKVGSLKGHPLYEYKYKGETGGEKHIGVMAQDVEKKRPEAVAEGSDGLKRVNYNILFKSR